ncbi:MAG: TIGR03943 family protein [Bifidobacterium sp.]|jgi:putative membrane protein|nr:TIGR03943 family protein [Bifidobacterium sp.]MCH4175128.1 TIGR03943 family protein [Bifidobacterium sp.]
MSTTLTPLTVTEPKTAKLLNRIEGFCLLLLATSISLLIITGRYQSFVTPRSLPYMILAIVVVVALAIGAFNGVFSANANTLLASFTLLVIPSLLFLLPISSSQSLQAFAGSRAIAISNTSKTSSLPGLDTKRKMITISNDDYGFWYNQIDKHADSYLGYTIIVNGQVSTSTSLGKGQYSAGRMLMTCCVLDMTAFGFTIDASQTAVPQTDSWVHITGTLERGRIGSASQHYEGLVLKATSVSTTDSATGYFYYA